MDEACITPELFENPAMLNAVLKFLASEKHGRDIEVLMPYGDYLKSLSEWYIQLLAESLGKTYNRRGEKVYYGRTPIVAVGTTDMHAQTQQHQEGRLNKVVQFVRVEKWKNDFEIPNVFPSVEKLASFSGAAMSSALETAREANEEALSGNHRFNALFSMPELTPYHLGELMYLLALSVAYEGELADVDAFDQPGVEVYKKIMGPRIAALGRKPSEG
jgi:glucose-6-phosphate isomerase